MFLLPLCPLYPQRTATPVIFWTGAANLALCWRVKEILVQPLGGLLGWLGNSGLGQGSLLLTSSLGVHTLHLEASGGTVEGKAGQGLGSWINCVWAPFSCRSSVPTRSQCSDHSVPLPYPHPHPNIKAGGGQAAMVRSKLSSRSSKARKLGVSCPHVPSHVPSH